MIISRTPFRVSLFGGGTDYPVWYEENGGAVLATTIDKYCYLTCRYLPPFFDHRSRIVWSKIELVQEITEISHPAVRETLAFLGIHDGVDIHHDGDLPARAGLGSSSSFIIGLLHVLYALKGEMPNKKQLAENAIHIERERLNENVGSQDQVLAAFGGLNRIDFGGEHEFRVSPLILPRKRLAELQEHLMLVFTGISRNASEIAKEQIQATGKKRTELTSIYQTVEEAVELLMGSGDLSEVGALLHEGWMLKRSLTERVSDQTIDAIYETARKAGAIGGKLLGAGGGGFMLLLVKPEQQETVKLALNDLLHVPFRFESVGSQIIHYDPPEEIRVS